MSKLILIMRITVISLLCAFAMSGCKSSSSNPVEPPVDDPEPEKGLVTIKVDNVTPTTITCSFEMNEGCVEYYILASKPEDIEPWIGSPFAGATIEETVEAWGIKYEANATYTWKEMVPNSLYVIYVTAKDTSGLSVLFTDTVTTSVGGGHGVSVVTVTVTDITGVGATTTATPNDQTMMFKDMVFEKGLYDNIHAYYEGIDAQTADQMTSDSLFRMLKEDVYEYYEEDKWVWENLDSGTDYMFMAAGMNADSIWGEMAMTSFKTLGDAPSHKKALVRRR
ncbi:MAG: hypothetical protein MJ001_00940 [Paludibacteraceae bacterium]|nr:hypothetical protein [Paludibacteraceae bacterium]